MSSLPLVTKLLRLCLGLSLVVFRASAALPQDESAAAQPVTSEIVQRLVAENEQRAQNLGSYTARRHYHVAYVGFPHAAEADMVVDAVCNGPNSKHFDIVSESGSRLLRDHVLKKLLKTEQDDAQHRADSALTPANYTFSLVGTEQAEGRLLYILSVEPKIPRALLYRGKIWVDAADYAVVKVEAHPAKSPSFWIRDTEINRAYAKAGDFWLPGNDWSETKVRLGGTAVLTIEYRDYRFATAATPAPSSVQTQALR
ncbi:MAG TPA: hypothetical protein VME68_11570 [Acidobacteriaceae bacterium]|nr:hypothetical protein [Acidobacteriaceae bacterium]